MKTNVLYIILGLLQAGLTSGLIFGWPALQLLLVLDGAFEKDCDPNESQRPCCAQIMHFNTIFTVSLFANNISTLLTGTLLDKIGPKWSNFGCFVCFLAGCIPFILHKESLYVVGFTLFGFFGPGVYVSIMHLSNLYPKNRSFIMSVFSGTFTVSSLVFKLFYIFYKDYTWVDLPKLFSIFALILAPLIILGVIVWPTTPFDSDESEGSDTDSDTSLVIKHGKLYNVSVLIQLKSMQFWIPIVWMAFQALHIHSYVGSVTVYFMNWPSYISAFNWIWLGAIVAIPLFGIMLDKGGTTLSFFVCSVLFLLFSICATLNILPLQYATFVFVSVGNLGVWGVFYSYLAQVFGVKNYGKILGVAMGFISLVGLLQYPILSFSINTLNYNFFYPNLGFICLSAILCLLPVYLWSVNRDTKQRKPLLVVNHNDLRGINDSEGDENDSYDETQGLLPPSRAV